MGVADPCSEDAAALHQARLDHHYNPQFYLDQWTGADGKLLYYKRVATGAIIETSIAPRSTSYEPNLYAAPPALAWETHDPHLIEKEVMSPIDSAASLVLKKLVQDNPIALTSTDRVAFATFLNSLQHRHRDPILERDVAAPQMAREFKAKLLERYASPADQARVSSAISDEEVEQIAKNAHRSAMVQAIRNGEAIEDFQKLAWDVIAVPSITPLITTDRPLLVNLGEGGAVQIATMALSPTRLFMGYPAWWQTKADTADVIDLFEHIALVHDLMLLNEQKCRYVYSSRRVESFVVGDKTIHLRKAVEQALARWPL